MLMSLSLFIFIFSIIVLYFCTKKNEKKMSLEIKSNLKKKKKY